METILIDTDYITVGQLLKLAQIAATGGEGKLIIQSGAVSVNGEVEFRRGRKLYPGDQLGVESYGSVTIARKSEE